MRFGMIIKVVLRAIRRLTQCRFGRHWDVTRLDNRGVAGGWVCNDCGDHGDPIVWPRPPKHKRS